MQGVGRTVFEGAPDRRVPGRASSASSRTRSGRRQSLILARLEGGPLAETGVIAGMSGSPVFIDGRLVGAVAYAFPFGKEPIAGITPIARDDRGHRAPSAPRAASARFRVALGRAPGGAARPRSRGGRPAPARPLARARDACRRGTLPPGPRRRRARPLALPLVFSGFEPDTFEWARGVFSSMGFAPVLGGGGRAGAAPAPLPDLAPGGRGRRLPRRGRPRPLRHGNGDPRRRGPRLRVRPPLLQPRPHPVPPEEGLGVLGLPEPPGLVEDRGRPRRRGHDGPGPHHRHRRSARRGAPHDPGGRAPALAPVGRPRLPLPHGRGRALHAAARLRLAPLGPAGARARLRGRDRCGSTPASPSRADARSGCATSSRATSRRSRRPRSSRARSPSSWRTTSSA